MADSVSARDEKDAHELARKARSLIDARRARYFVGENARYAELEDVFLTLEGIAQWTGCRWLTHPRGGARADEAGTLAMFRRGGRRWSQDEGLALFLAIDRFVPDWRDRAFTAPVATALELLARARAASREGMAEEIVYPATEPLGYRSTRRGQRDRSDSGAAGSKTGDNDMRRFLRIVTLVLALALFGNVAHAHHSQAGIFDSRKTIEITGIVKSVSWRNPHGQILLAVRDEKGVETIWDAETASISILRNRGVDGSSIRVGDRVTIAGSPSMRARPEILARNVLLPNGTEFTFGSATPYFAAGKAGRVVGGVKIAADVAAAKAKADGLFRVWSTIMSDPAAFPMFKGGYPLTAAGKAGLAKWNPRNNTLLKCGTKGTPLIMISPLPMEFSRDGDKIIMRLEEYDSVRTIHMNPKAVAPAAHTLFGFSRGRWEGTTLVVETDHIAAGYFDHEGTPQSDQIRTVERFIPNADYSRLDYTLTTIDPVNFTKPFELKRYFVWKPENRVHPYECLDRFEPGK